MSIGSRVLQKLFLILYKRNQFVNAINLYNGFIVLITKCFSSRSL